MKKILGSPIGLGEINLTVDNRVRRRIKEYFGNVDDNSFEIRLISIADTSYDNSKVQKLKIGVKAPEENLNKTFIIVLPNKYEFFIPTKKDGDWLESEPLFMSQDSLKTIINPQANFSAKLPTTDIEKKAAEEWKEDKLATAKYTANATQGATQGTIDKENKEQLCKNRPKSDCHEWNDTKKVCEQVLDKGGCVEDDFELCCTSQECKNKKKTWYKKNVIGVIVKIITGIAIFVAIVDFFAFFNYQHHYGRRIGNFLLSFINFVRKQILQKDEIQIDEDYGFYSKNPPKYNTDGDEIKKDSVKETAWFFAITSFILIGLLGLRALFPLFYKIGLINPFEECTFDDEEEKEEEKDDSCPAGKIKKTCMDGTKKCRTICGINKKFSTSKCKCVPK